MRTRRMGMLAAVAAVVGSSLLFAAPAHAEQVGAGCSTGFPHESKLNATANYTTNGANRTWQSAGFKFTTAQYVTGSQVDIKLHAGNQMVWSYGSPGGLDSDVQYEVPINVTVPASQSSNLTFRALFDVPFMPDPTCTAWLT